MMQHFYLISFLLVSFFMLHSLKQPPIVPWRLRLRHFVATAAVSVLTSEDAYAVFFYLTHPQAAFANFYVPKGFAPGWLYFSLNVAGIIMGAIIWLESAALATRKAKARPVFLIIWPIYVVTFLIGSMAVVQAHDDITGTGQLFAFYILAPAFILLLALVIDLHFRSPSSDDLFLPQQAA